jgi:hypothetical protein
MVDTSKKYKIVGQGDDVINDWHTPLADYHLLINALAHCEEIGVEFPIQELISLLTQRGYGVKDSGPYSISSTEDLFEVLLHPHLSIRNEAWGGDSPGRSGVYKTAFLELGHTKHIRKILKESEQFIINWIESSEINTPQNTSIIKTDSVAKQITQENNETEILRQQWEDRLFNQVEIAVRENQKLIRLNYFVFQGVIFYLNRSWWHSLGGSVENVTNRLRSAGFQVVDIEVISTQIGWIPYFARHKEEELNLGWNEKTIKINCPKEWIKQLDKARMPKE